VLLVEDNWHVAQAMSSILKAAGVHIVGPAASLIQAELFLSECEPDIAVVDLNLQGEMADGLIEQLAARHIPVIIISGYVPNATRSESVAAVLEKPVRAETFLATLKQVLVASRVV
jgi:DNA-binding NtrC family response regulator